MDCVLLDEVALSPEGIDLRDDLIDLGRLLVEELVVRGDRLDLDVERLVVALLDIDGAGQLLDDRSELENLISEVQTMR